MARLTFFFVLFSLFVIAYAQIPNIRSTSERNTRCSALKAIVELVSTDPKAGSLIDEFCGLNNSSTPRFVKTSLTEAGRRRLAKLFGLLTNNSSSTSRPPFVNPPFVNPPSVNPPSINSSSTNPDKAPPTEFDAPVTGASSNCPVYIIQSRDSLSAIASKYGTSVEEICNLNGISNPNYIQIGQRITIPCSGSGSPPPPPPPTGSGPISYNENDVDVLGRTLWGEARGEGDSGMIAVAWSVVERARDSRWPRTIAGVCQQPWQFSCWNSGSSERARLLSLSNESDFLHCKDIARSVLSGQAGSPFSSSCVPNHYFNPSIVLPSWAASMRFCKSIGRHDFYRG